MTRSPEWGPTPTPQDQANTMRQQVEIIHRLVELGYPLEASREAVMAGDLAKLTTK